MKSISKLILGFLLITAFTSLSSIFSSKNFNNEKEYEKIYDSDYSLEKDPRPDWTYGYANPGWIQIPFEWNMNYLSGIRTEDQLKSDYIVAYRGVAFNSPLDSQEDNLKLAHQIHTDFPTLYPLGENWEQNIWDDFHYSYFIADNWDEWKGKAVEDRWAFSSWVNGNYEDLGIREVDSREAFEYWVENSLYLYHYSGNFKSIHTRETGLFIGVVADEDSKCKGYVMSNRRDYFHLAVDLQWWNNPTNLSDMAKKYTDKVFSLWFEHKQLFDKEPDDMYGSKYHSKTLASDFITFFNGSINMSSILLDYNIGASEIFPEPPYRIIEAALNNEYAYEISIYDNYGNDLTNAMRFPRRPFTIEISGSHYIDHLVVNSGPPLKLHFTGAIIDEPGNNTIDTIPEPPTVWPEHHNDDDIYIWKVFLIIVLPAIIIIGVAAFIIAEIYFSKKSK